MKEHLDILGHSFHEVDAPDHLYENILAKIEAKEAKVISPTWVKVSAVAASLLILLNIYSINQKATNSKEEQLNSIVYKSNIQLYNE